MAQCMTPLVLQRKDEGRTIPVPCGKCPACLKRRTSNWSFRLMQEYRRCDTAYFITLTYDPEFVPVTRRKFMSLQKKDLQNFFKRLRVELNRGFPRAPRVARYRTLPNRRLYFPNKAKYFAVGEYGTKLARPHYHIILFNASPDTVEQAWSRYVGFETYVKLGYVHFGEVNEASVGYTLKYMQKPSKIPLHANDDREKEFQLMSKGLGSNYITQAIKKWHKAALTERMYCNLPDGKKIAMPRYYKDRIYTVEERSCVSGFNKGRFEKMGDERILNSSPEDERKRSARVAQDFRNMYANATKNRKI